MSEPFIPTHRKATCTMRLTDAFGNPLAHHHIHVQQTRHEFLFGCGAFDFLSYVTATNEADRQFLKDRTDKWLDVFNYGTIPFYWGRF